MEWFKKIIAQIGNLWGKWSMLQRMFLVGIVVAVVAGIGLLLTVSSSPSMVALFNGAPVRDDSLRDRIMIRLDQEGIKAIETPTGVIQVEDKQIAKKASAILAREDLIPPGTDPWAIFDQERWTTTDFERNVRLHRALEQTVKDHIRALDDVDKAEVKLTFPKDVLFASEQNPVTASIQITPKPGSDITENRKKIEGIQKLIKFAVEGLTDEHIVITDNKGNELNDFEGMREWDRLSRVERETKMTQKWEKEYRDKILASLQNTYTPDRVRDMNIKFTIDMSQKSVATEEFFPITMKPRTPGLPYDDSVLLPSIPRSRAESHTDWEGTGMNPEGPAGVEGQVAPAYKDMNNLWGKTSQVTEKVNEEINTRRTQEERSPEINRVTVSVNIDGTWKFKYDEKRNFIIEEDGSRGRIYVPVPPEELEKARALIRDAIGYNAARGDSVTVKNIAYDRSREFGLDDAAYFRKKQIETTVMIFLGGLALLLIAFILFRTISREIERRRRLEAEERARREEALRQQALLQAEEEGMDVSISVEERTRMELQEAVANMTKEHPEDAAQLIRTWLLEE
jgi:flagellar M-ring protein FliF